MSRSRSSSASKRTAAVAKNTAISHAGLLRQTLEWFAKDDGFAKLPLHGNVSWTVTQLVHLAVLWVWSDHKKLTAAFQEAHQLALRMFQHVAVGTYQGLLGALRSYSGALLPQLWSHLQQLMEHSAGEARCAAAATSFTFGRRR